MDSMCVENMETCVSSFEPKDKCESLLTFADMALALEIPRVDHSYALDEEIAPKLLDSECIVQREKDHNYSNISKHGHNIEEPADFANGGFQSCQMYKRSLSEEDLTKKSTFSGILSAPQNIGHNRKSISTENMSCDDDGMVNNVGILCNSWPKKNFFPRDHTYARGELQQKSQEKIFKKPSKYSDHAYFVSQQNKSSLHVQCDPPKMKSAFKKHVDHAYFGKHGNFEHLDNENLNSNNSSSEINSSITLTEHHHLDIPIKKGLKSSVVDHSSEIKAKISVKSDHAYFGKSLPSTEMPKRTVPVPTPFIKLVTDPHKCGSDHNYYNGSLESLDMDMSASDTDSCDETAQEETRLAFSAWCQLRKDHPYSSI